MKVLIIDDSKVMRFYLEHLVRGFRLDSMVAEDGRRALETLEGVGGFDLALVDWDMPEMNGIEFIKAVRADPQHSELKMMMVTTQNTLEHVSIALAAGATDFLMKPVSRESLEEKLRVLGIVP